MEETAKLVITKYRALNQKPSELKETINLPLKRPNQVTSASLSNALIEIDVETV